MVTADSGNLIVQGDNLHALKALLPRYAGKVKCIYIDPPYNTGNEGWVYNDNVNSPEIKKWLGELVGKEGETLDRHDRWLCMMYPRLVMLRQFLKDDGVIFVSIDNEEIGNLRILMDEIFGGNCFVECIAWNKRIPKNDALIGNIHEYILIYKKSVTANIKFTMRKDGLDEVYELLDRCKYKDVTIEDTEKKIRQLYKERGFDRGVTLYNNLDENYKLWGKINVSWPNGNTFGPMYEVLHPITEKPVKIPDRGWRWKQETFDELLNDGGTQNIQDGSIISGKIWFSKDERTQPSSVKYLEEVENILLRSILSLKSNGGMDLEDVFLKKNIFAYPKPVGLIKLLINSIEMNDGDIVFDSFAGSGTTALATMELNSEDQTKRSFICIEMLEDIAKNITAERCRKICTGYKNSKGEVIKGNNFSFQYCKLSKDPLFDANGQISSDVGFSQLAEFVWFAETGSGFTGKGDSPLLGIHEGRAIYLLYNGILKDKSVDGGNVLTTPVLNVLPEFDGSRVIYAAACRLGASRLNKLGIVFKQTPYALEV